jgi:hypothetical protein
MEIERGLEQLSWYGYMVEGIVQGQNTIPLLQA